MSYHHITIEERICLREYYIKGYSYRKIAKLLGRNVSTISRELRWNCTHTYDIPTYYPYTAQRKCMLRKSYCHRGMFWSQEMISYIEEKLIATWSSEQISKSPSPFEKMPSWRTIYRWLYDKYLLRGNLKVLRRKGKTHLGKETRGKYTNWKADTMAAVIEKALSEYPPQLVKSITCDRGSEFANWPTIEKELNCDVYFADPYCAWQKGTNENCNGLLREFYPKGRNLSRVSPKTLLRNLALINARPRKDLNFISAQDAWNAELSLFS